MELTPETVEDYAHVAQWAPWGDKQQLSAAHLATLLGQKRMARFLEYQGGRPAAIAAIQNFFADVYVLGFVKAPEFEDAGETVLMEAIEEVKARGGSELAIRVIDGPGAEKMSRQIAAVGFRLQSSRIEYRAPVASLPSEAGTPLRWEPLAALNDKSIAFAGEILVRTGEGDPDFGENIDGAALIRGYLEDTALTHDLDCIHIGYLGEKVFGAVIAQINPTSKWSRITYMGMLPEFRGRKLGVWVHRHGFEMLKRQGGELYHGGTLEQNHAMNALFKKHGCQEHRRMKEWNLGLK